MSTINTVLTLTLNILGQRTFSGKLLSSIGGSFERVEILLNLEQKNLEAIVNYIFVNSN